MDEEAFGQLMEDNHAVRCVLLAQKLCNTWWSAWRPHSNDLVPGLEHIWIRE